MNIIRQRKQIVIVATATFPMKMFMSSHVLALRDSYDITLIANGDSAEIEALLIPDKVRFLNVPIQRKIALLSDLKVLFILIRLFLVHRPSVVFSITPKAGLLCALAAKLAGVPARLHIFTGQVWASRLGLSRWLLKMADRLIASLVTNVLADSFSQRDFLVAEGVVAANRIHVLANGSACGVDTARFKPDHSIRSSMRQALGIPMGSLVILYLGRLNRDKGVLELARAFRRFAHRYPKAWLVLAGPDEEGLHNEVRAICSDVSGRVLQTGYISAPERYMAMSDVLCLPSHREGFGSVIIEAGACAVPSIASRIYGITDAVVDEQTGLLFSAGDEDALEACMIRLAEDPALLNRLGGAARVRATKDFSTETVTQALVNYINEIVS